MPGGLHRIHGISVCHVTGKFMRYSQFIKLDQSASVVFALLTHREQKQHSWCFVFL